MWAITGMPTSSATCSAMSSGKVPERPEARAPTRTLIPTIKSRLAFATSIASIGAISRISSHSPTITRGEEIRLMAPIDAMEVANANRDLIVGIKVRVGARASGRSGSAPLDIALQVADEVGMPVMAHIDDPPPTYEEVLARLRPGDMLTHAFRPYPNAPVTAQGTIKQAVNEARRRGVLFDIGHGKGSFAFKTARAMLANGFFPDTISSDVHALCINGPAFDQVTTMSKFP